MTETKVIYHLEGEDTPFLIKIPLDKNSIKLKDLKLAISQNNSPTHKKYKYIFKTFDEDVEIAVKIEVHDDEQILPNIDNRIICWLKPIKNPSHLSQSHNSNNYNNTNTVFDLDQPITVSSSTPNTTNLIQQNQQNDSGNGSSNHAGDPGGGHILHNRQLGPSENETNTIEKLNHATKNLSIVKTSSTLNTSANNSNNNNTLDKKNKPKPPPRNSTQQNLLTNPTPNSNDLQTQNQLENELEQRRLQELMLLQQEEQNHLHKHQTKKYFSNLKRFPSDTTLDSTMTEGFGNLQQNRKSLENEFFDDGSSRYSTMTTSTNFADGNRNRRSKHRRKKMHKHSNNPSNNGLITGIRMTESVSTFSSMTDSTVSLNIVLATLDMVKYDTLGITLISDQNGGPVLVGYVFPTGAVAADGRIERGDIIIEINGISVEDKSTDDAVDIIRREAKNPINGTIMMTVAKQPLFPSEAEIAARSDLQNGFNQPESERQPSVPISCAQWVKSSQSHQQQSGMYHPFSGSTTSIETSSDTLASSVPDGTSDQWTQFGFYGGGPQKLTLNTAMMQVVKVMSQRNSGLEIKDRQWLKIHIPRAVIGSELVDWLYSHIEGLEDRRNARRYAATLLKAGFIRHTIEKVNFSEQCYYTFADPVSQQNAQRELLRNGAALPAPLNHLRYGATHLAADAMSIMSESSNASTVKEIDHDIANNHIHQFPNNAQQGSFNYSNNQNSGKRFSPANSVTPSVAYQSGWNPAPSAAQNLWAGQNNGNFAMPNGGGFSDDTQSIISMSSSISQQHLKVAQQRMEKRQRKKMSKSAQSVGLKSNAGNNSGSSGSGSNPNKNIQNLSNGQKPRSNTIHNPDGTSLKSSYSDGNKSHLHQHHAQNNMNRLSPLINKVIHKSGSESSSSGQQNPTVLNNQPPHLQNMLQNSNQSQPRPNLPQKDDDLNSEASFTSKKLLPSSKPLGYQPAEITASRLSFAYAMDNPLPSPMPNSNNPNHNFINEVSNKVPSSYIQPHSINNLGFSHSVHQNTLHSNKKEPPTAISARSISTNNTPHPMINGNILTNNNHNHNNASNLLHADKNQISMPNPPSIEQLKKMVKSNSSTSDKIVRQSTSNNFNLGN